MKPVMITLDDGTQLAGIEKEVTNYCIWKCVVAADNEIETDNAETYVSLTNEGGTKVMDIRITDDDGNVMNGGFTSVGKIELHLTGSAERENLYLFAKMMLQALTGPKWERRGRE